MLYPADLKIRVGGQISIVRIVTGNIHPIGCDAIAGVGKVRGLGLLWTVFGNGKTGESRPAWAELRDPADGRNRQHRLRAGGLRLRDEIVAVGAGGRARGTDAFEIPVRRVVRGVDLPVVTRRSVPARTVQRRVQVVQIGGGSERDTVNLRVDGMAARSGVHSNDHGRIGGWWRSRDYTCGIDGHV